MTKYICFEGSEGTGKTTQHKLIAQRLREMGFKVLETKEPGTEHSPLTMALRSIALNAEYDNHMTPLSREYILQSIRSIHLESIIKPSLDKYDYILQDRGQLSGLCYGLGCGIEEKVMFDLIKLTLNGQDLNSLYSKIIYFKGDITKGLERALTAKKEFEQGDAMENKGVSFLETVNQNFNRFLPLFNHEIFEVEGKSIQSSTDEILRLILK